MIGQIYYQAKTLMRPLTRHRRLFERAKYSGDTILSAQEGNDFIAGSIGRSAAIGKIGSSELAALRHYLRKADAAGLCPSWGWQATNLCRIAGVYPQEPVTLSLFCRAYAETLSHLDMLAVWFNLGEHSAHRRFAPNARLMALRSLDPFYHERPWTQCLAGQRVLVISPFSDTIHAQYRRRDQIWRSKPELLPGFELLTLRSPMSAFLAPPVYRDWFAALDAMCEQMSSIPFDSAIVGAGAWSLPLVARAKSLGKWAIHLGGATQILFGIKGGRWDNSPEISAFYNDAWTRPSALETPPNVTTIEGACYW
jgi:hypothetical protein